MGLFTYLKNLSMEKCCKESHDEVISAYWTGEWVGIDQSVRWPILEWRVGRDRSVGTVAHYWPDGPGIE
jgi:hypothetical protein